MYEDTKVSQLVINQLTEEKFKELLENDELDPNQLYCTDDKVGYTPPLLSTLWSDHLLNDISWLRADTFSWQSGDVYVAAYNHLVNCMADATEETEMVDGIEITYHLAQNKRKICLPDQEDKLLELYNKTGVAWYYILDEDNTQFKLPRTKPAKRLPFAEIANADVNGYVAYSQGYGDSGGIVGTSNLWFSSGDGIVFGGAQSKSLSDEGIVNTSVNLDNARINSVTAEQYLYFYVGNFERDAVEQTAGVTTETLNGKADSDLGNIPANYDYVVESQMPTAENGYTWYRKYKSGWVEMGGITSVNNVTFPVEMADTSYTFFRTNGNGRSATGANELYTSVSSRTTTGFMIICENAITPVSWCVYGIAK